MFIFFSESFHDRVSEFMKNSDFVEALNNLLLCHRSGKHIVSGPRPVLRGLLYETTGESHGVLKKIVEKSYEFPELKNQLTHYVIVEPGAGSRIREARVRDQIVYHVPYRYFQDFERLGQSRIVAEDSDDARVYGHVAEAWCERSPTLKRGLHVSLQHYGGGGSSLADHLRDHAQRGFTLGITDNDQKWPGGPEGNTVQTARKARKELEGRAVCELYSLFCHELENLLPAKLILESLTPGKDDVLIKKCEKADRLGILGAQSPDHPLKSHHLDLKKGLCKFDLFTAEPEARQVFFLALFQALGGRRGFCENTPDCSERSTCRCTLFEGLGDRLVARVANYLARLSPQKLAELFFAGGLDRNPAWAALGRLLFSWGCAYERIRV